MKKSTVRVSNIPKLVYNKRKHMEKALSQAQRDQLLMNSAKEDVLMKQQMMKSFDQSNNTLEDSISKMTNCLTSLGEGIASGMRMLATALAGNTANPMHVALPQMYHHPQYYGGIGHQPTYNETPLHVNRNQVPNAVSPQSTMMSMENAMGHSSPETARGPIVSATQTLYETDNGSTSMGFY